MDQNQTNNSDDDLQKAIDNITNTTNVDPVFSDPVAAPSSVPEGDTGQLDEPVGPFPAPEPEIPAPEVPPLPENPAAEATPAPEMPAPDAAPAPEMPPIPAPEAPEMPPVPTDTTAPTPEISNSHSPLTSTPSTNPDMSVREIKESALRDLVPLLERLNIDPEQKFGLYRNIFEELKDYSVLNPAYAAAKNISGDTERAEALLYLIESIDKM